MTRKNPTHVYDEKNMLTYINSHREAVGRKPFPILTQEQIEKHLALIDEHAPNDPWEV